jgi:acyl-CoA synthetase (AMP-forming)/AMP-acid ligase II
MQARRYQLNTGLHQYQNFSNLSELLLYRAQGQPDQNAYTFLRGGEVETEKLTYKTLLHKAQAIAAQLQKLGVSGERALLLYQPGLEFIAAFFGCLFAPMLAVPAYPPRKNQNLSRLQAIASSSQARVVLTTAALLDQLQSDSRQIPELVNLQWLATDTIEPETAAEWQEIEVNSETIAFLQYTSGSTGNPKGVMVSHGNLLHNSAVIHQCFGHQTTSQGLIWLPPYHDMGLIGGIIQPLYGGLPVVLMSPVDFLQKPYRWLQAISRYQATTSGGPNFAYDLCVRKVTPEQMAGVDLSSWEVAFTGAEPIRATTLEQFATTFAPYGFRKEAFYPCYGMAETTLLITGGVKTALPIERQLDSTALEQNRVVETTRNHENARTIVGCGQNCLEQKLVIVNPDTLTLCGAEQVGEIWVSGASVAQGYWEQPEETEKTFHAYLADTGEGPFLRTGDLGFLQDGELFVTGRIKDVIIIRGQNHYPQDIELTVEKSHPSLRIGCCAAFAVEFQGSERLVIVVEVERSYLKKLDVQEVVGSIKQAVVTQHGLDIFAAVLVKTGSIPKTSSGKIRRHACRAEFLTGSLDVVKDWSENPQATTKYINLQAEIDSMLNNLQAEKRV